MAVHVKDILFASRGDMGIGKSLVDCLLCIGHYRADCVGIIAERYREIKGNAGYVIQGF